MTQSGRLTCTVRTLRGGAPCVALTGELDVDSAPLVESAVETIALAPHGGLIIDLTGLTFCDSSGVTALLRAYDRAESAGAATVVAGLTDSVGKLFELTGLDEVFTIRPTTADAEAALTGAP